MVSYSTGLLTAFRDSRIFAVSLSDKTRLPGQGYPRCQTAGRQVVWTPEEQAAVWHSLRQRETLACWLVPRRRNCKEKRPQIRTIRCGTPPIERGRKGIHEKRKPRDLIYPRHRRGAPHRRDARRQTEARVGNGRRREELPDMACHGTQVVVLFLGQGVEGKILTRRESAFLQGTSNPPRTKGGGHVPRPF